MAAVFKALASPDRGYECIRPLRILRGESEDNEENADDSYDIEEQRECIAKFLCSILKKAQ